MCSPQSRYMIVFLRLAIRLSVSRTSTRAEGPYIWLLAAEHAAVVDPKHYGPIIGGTPLLSVSKAVRTEY